MLGPCTVRFHVQEGQGQGDDPCMVRPHVQGLRVGVGLVW